MPSRSNMEPYGSIFRHMDPYGAIWGPVEPYGVIWAHLEPYGAIWTHAEPYGRMRPKQQTEVPTRRRPSPAPGALQIAMKCTSGMPWDHPWGVSTSVCMWHVYVRVA